MTGSDGPDAKPPKALMFETGTNMWRRYDSWPPKNAHAKNLYFMAGGKLTFTAPQDSASAYDEYVSDPNRPVPFIDMEALTPQAGLYRRGSTLRGKTSRCAGV